MNTKKAKHHKVIPIIIFFCLIITVIFIQNQYAPEKLPVQLQNLLNSEVKFSNGIFSGEIGGSGIFEVENGDIYCGDFTDFEYDGDGEIHFISGDNYQGQFCSSTYNGDGKYTWANGDTYNGNWVNGEFDGQGTYIFADNNILTGTFSKNSFLHGRHKSTKSDINFAIDVSENLMTATIIFPDGTHFSGKINNRKISGQGIMDFYNGDKYIGNFENGVRCGDGNYYWQNGDVYRGNWINDEPYGQGTYTLANGNEFVGTYKNKKMNISEAVIVSRLSSGTTITATYKQNKKINYYIEFANGDSYKGDISDGKFSGNGTYKWKNGANYTGEWSDGAANGTGTLYYSDKNKSLKLVGTFKNNLPTDTCLYYPSKKQSTKSYETIWENGKCIEVK